MSVRLPIRMLPASYYMTTDSQEPLQSGLIACYLQVLHKKILSKTGPDCFSRNWIRPFLEKIVCLVVAEGSSAGKMSFSSSVTSRTSKFIMWFHKHVLLVLCLVAMR
jgi:hypothetical protein